MTIFNYKLNGKISALIILCSVLGSGTIDASQGGVAPDQGLLRQAPESGVVPMPNLGRQGSSESESNGSQIGGLRRSGSDTSLSSIVSSGFRRPRSLSSGSQQAVELDELGSAARLSRSATEITMFTGSNGSIYVSFNGTVFSLINKYDWKIVQQTISPTSQKVFNTKKGNNKLQPKRFLMVKTGQDTYNLKAESDVILYREKSYMTTKNMKPKVVEFKESKIKYQEGKGYIYSQASGINTSELTGSDTTALCTLGRNELTELANNGMPKTIKLSSSYGKQQAAATKIQAVWRGSRVRRQRLGGSEQQQEETGYVNLPRTEAEKQELKGLVDKLNTTELRRYSQLINKLERTESPKVRLGMIETESKAIQSMSFVGRNGEYSTLLSISMSLAQMDVWFEDLINALEPLDTEARLQRIAQEKQTIQNQGLGTRESSYMDILNRIQTQLEQDQNPEDDVARDPIVQFINAIDIAIDGAARGYDIRDIVITATGLAQRISSMDNVTNDLKMVINLISGAINNLNEAIYYANMANNTDGDAALARDAASAAARNATEVATEVSKSGIDEAKQYANRIAELANAAAALAIAAAGAQQWGGQLSPIAE